MIVDFADVNCCDKKLVGGKAFHLAWLQRNKFKVPFGAVILSSFFQELIEQMDLKKKVEDLNSCSQSDALILAGQIRQKILGAQIPVSVLDEIQKKILSHPSLTDKWLAVRSSAVCEDGDSSSFAGQLESILFVKGEKKLGEAILQVFASCFSERVVHYCFFQNLPKHFLTAVIIQEMIDADVSGVMFTADPVTGNRKHMRISSNFGIGEGVVSGSCSCDEFTVSEDGTIISNIVRKEMMTALAPVGGTLDIAVNSNIQNTPSLSPSQLRELFQWGKKAAGLKQCPQDIEWCFKGTDLYVLQTRPVTTLPPEGKGSSQTYIFDNSNIQESYCGVTTPLTFSFASEAYFNVYSQVMRVMNFSEEKIADHARRHKSMLGFIEGRIYYNINHWHEGLLLLPSFGRNKEDMERMMGVTESVDFVQDQNLTVFEKLKKTPQMFFLLSKLILKFMRMRSLVANFEKWFGQEYQKIDRTSFQTLDSNELFQLGLRVKKKFLQNWATPILNDFYVMMLNGKVHRLLKAAKLENRMVDLMAGEDIASTAPTKLLLRITDQVRGLPEVRAAFEGELDSISLEKIQVLNEDVYSGILNYIELFGDRCVGELKLESISMREDPAFIFSVIKSYLKKADLSFDSFVKREQNIRQSSEIEVFTQIRKLKGPFGLILFKKNIRALRQAIKYRETMRLARTRVFGIFRSIYLEVGKRYFQNKLIAGSRDIFFLSEEEIDQVLTFKISHGNLKSLIQERKVEFQRCQDTEPPSHFRGVVARSPVQESPKSFQKSNVPLQGIGCFPGVVKSAIRLVKVPRPDLELSGKILCAVRTDPGWTPLFANIDGLVVERGSTLSHSAVVAREMGIPAVVGISNVTEILSDGEMIEMDGGLGSVRRLEI